MPLSGEGVHSKFRAPLTLAVLKISILPSLLLFRALHRLQFFGLSPSLGVTLGGNPQQIADAGIIQLSVDLQASEPCGLSR